MQLTACNVHVSEHTRIHIFDGCNSLPLVRKTYPAATKPLR